jgi:hypothetical protein
MPEPREHHKVGVDADAGETASAARRQRVLVLEPPELSFDSGTATIRGRRLLTI